MHIIKDRVLIFATVEIRLIPQLVGVFGGLPTPSNTSMCFCVHCRHVIHVAIFMCVEKLYFNIVTKSLLCVMLYISNYIGSSVSNTRIATQIKSRSDVYTT